MTVASEPVAESTPSSPRATPAARWKAAARRSAELAVRSAPRALVVCASAAFISAFVWVAFRRMRYPFELEWMEGGSLDHVHRLRMGQSLYVAPSVEFVPFIYNPLFYYLALPFTWILGESFFPLRL